MADDRRNAVILSPNNAKIHALESYQPHPQSLFSKITLQILDHWSFTIFMAILTIYALIGDDIRVSAFSKSSDPTFYILTSICLFFFTIEIIFSSICKPNYFLGFFFWLDLIATVSLITDIGWIWDLMIGNTTSGSSASSTANVARAGRASRAGARAARIIRIIRVIRLIRIVKLYKIAKDSNKILNQNRLVRGVTNYKDDLLINSKSQIITENGGFVNESGSASLSMSFGGPNHMTENFEGNESQRSVGPSENSSSVLEEIENPEEINEESKVGKELSELTTRKLILLVLAILFGTPFFMNNLYVDDNNAYEYGLLVMDSVITNNSDFRKSWDSYINLLSNDYTPLIYSVVLSKDEFTTGVNPDDLRDSEIQYYVLGTQDPSYIYFSYAIFDLRSQTRLDAILSICKTTFICLVLAISTSILSRDAQIIVLDPIENMIEKVKKISQNPLEAAQEQEKKEVMQVKKNSKINENSETHYLENTLNKIAALLALGFGEAGSEIIAKNMNSGGGDVDPMIPGKKTHCIFGFCDIHDFADTTEVLRQDVLIFVNEIAFVVHKTVDFFSGNANKNIGDAFLLVWKFPDSVLQLSEDTKSYVLSKDQYVNQLADMSVLSFLKIIAEIHRNPKILRYRQHKELNSRLPGFSVKMGFGLHQGWAIEGAIGSQFKIDASYLSPNVNMASRLEAATKQFGVHLLVSSALYSICSQVTRLKLRKIDKVTVKGSKYPIELFTCDVNPYLLKPQELNGAENNVKKEILLSRIARNKMKAKAITGEFNVNTLWDDDPDLVMMRSQVSAEFSKEFGIALQDYLDGKWTEAKAGFEKAQKIKGDIDGPSQVIMEFMAHEGGSAPTDWKGFRELHDK